MYSLFTEVLFSSFYHMRRYMRRVY